MPAPPPKPVMLVILDGWGWREEEADNAVRLARTPTFDALWAAGPRAFLRTSGHDVGLPDGQMGNSEVGHLNIGAGRVVMQDLPRIDAAVADGSLAASPVLAEFIAKLRASGGTCHLLGLVSPGGVHSHQRHAVALARVAVRGGHSRGASTPWTDGRDTPPRAAPEQLRALLDEVADLPGVRIATVIGRYYAMDRDKRWERVSQAYAAMVDAEGERAPDAVAAVLAAHARDVGDEFVPATVIGDYAGMRDGDGLLCFNFRADRVREILAALLDPDFAGFPRPRVPRFAAAAGMVEYSAALNALHDGPVPGAVHGGHPRRRGVGRRPHPAPHGGDREVPARHLLPERRHGDALPRRGAHHGALAQGRHLRPAAGDVGAGTDRQGGGGDPLRPLRPDRAELRQPRHGRPHRQPARRHPGGGDGGCRARPHRRGGARRPGARCSSPPTTAIAS